MNKKITVNSMKDVYKEVLKRLFNQTELFFGKRMQERIQLQKDKEGLHAPLPINDTYYVETNRSGKYIFDKLKYALEVFDLEDELTIKFCCDV